jgi:hypothetical protein
MPRPEKTSEIDRILDVIIKHDTRRRTAGDKVISDELLEAMDYYVRWGLARNRGRALIELAKPTATEVVQRVREVGIKAVEELSGIVPGPSGSGAKPTKGTRRRGKQGAPDKEE